MTMTRGFSAETLWTTVEVGGSEVEIGVGCVFEWELPSDGRAVVVSYEMDKYGRADCGICVPITDEHRSDLDRYQAPLAISDVEARHSCL